MQRHTHAACSGCHNDAVADNAYTDAGRLGGGSGAQRPAANRLGRWWRWLWFNTVADRDSGSSRWSATGRSFADQGSAPSAQNRIAELPQENGAPGKRNAVAGAFQSVGVRGAVRGALTTGPVVAGLSRPKRCRWRLKQRISTTAAVSTRIWGLHVSHVQPPLLP